ncbi:MAG: hypothetical protein OQK70_03685, partial [Gammaproteobacteria bacterium]|nr:hypothetical protein [Gammaproteobacteria bacterium]
FFAYREVGKGREHAYMDIGGRGVMHDCMDAGGRTTQETKSRSNCRGRGSLACEKGWSVKFRHQCF